MKILLSGYLLPFIKRSAACIHLDRRRHLSYTPTSWFQTITYGRKHQESRKNSFVRFSTYC